MFKYYFLITVLPNIDIIFGIIWLLSLFGAVGISIPLVLAYFDPGNENPEKVKRGKKVFAILCSLFILFGLLDSFIPTKEQINFYIAGSQAVEFNNVNKISPKIGEFISLYLNKEIKSLLKGDKK